MTVAMFPAEGLDASFWAEAVSESIEDLIAWVSLEKSPLAWLTTLVAALSIFFSCDSSPLMLEMLEGVRPLTAFSRSVRAEQ